MAEERPEDTASSPDSRPKRAPPTIDLEATEVSSEAPKAEVSEETAQDSSKDSSKESSEASADAAGHEPAPQPEAGVQPEPQAATASAGPESGPSRPVSPWVVAPMSGAVAAALVIGVGWLLGWPAVPPAPAPQRNADAIDELVGRVAGLEAKAARPAQAASDPAATARLEALDKSIAALRSELAATRAQSDKLAAVAPRDGAAAPDLSGITARIGRIEDAVKTQNAAIARQDGKIADTKAEAKPADDTPLRRMVVASLLDVAVRHGDPFVAALDAAKTLADNPDALKPLDAFAASGVPNANTLCRELIEIVPKLTPPAAEVTSTGSSIIDRLQAAKLIRVERVDGSGTDRASIVSRATTAAMHNDLATAVRELKSLPPADRAAAQAWLDKVDARSSALGASRKFADTAMAALASVNQ